tara:strand:- start:1591 stop:1932 length:342 start_codon:yes stop_codon:yes gene_type:complete
MGWYKVLKATREHDLNNPIQENPKRLSLEMRRELGRLFGEVNRQIPNIEEWALRDKKNSQSLKGIAQKFRVSITNLKNIIAENQGGIEYPQFAGEEYVRKPPLKGKWVKSGGE